MLYHVKIFTKVYTYDYNIWIGQEQMCDFMK